MLSWPRHWGVTLILVRKVYYIKIILYKGTQKNEMYAIIDNFSQLANNFLIKSFISQKLKWPEKVEFIQKKQSSLSCFSR